MLFKAIVGRESGYKLRLNLNEIVEEFRCIRLDNHCIEGQEGNLIPPLACSFSKVDPHLLAVSDEDGGLVIYDTEKVGPLAVRNDWLSHSNAVFDLEWTAGENSLLTASGDQTIVLWDVSEEEKVATFRGHTSSVKTVQYRHNDRFVFASGSRDGHIMIWDRRIATKDGAVQPVNILHNAHSCRLRKMNKRKQETQQSVTAIAFQDDHTFLSAGSVDGSIKMWDLRRTHCTKKSGPLPKYSFDYAGTSLRTHGFSNLVLDSSRTRLFASCIDNVIYQFDCASLKQRPVACYRGHINSTFYVKTALSPGDRYLLSGSSDGNAYIWPVDLPMTSPLALKGHVGEVSGVAWCPADFTKIVTLGDDNTMNFWRLSRRSRLLPNPADLIGWTEKTRSESAATSSQLTSPMKGTMLPRSPAKVSSAVRRNLVAMATATSSSSVVGGLTSPSLAKWVSLGSDKSRPSPRKLQVTPKKCTGSTFVGQSSEERVMKERVKRKLCDDIIGSPVAISDGSPASGKRHKSCEENATTSLASPICHCPDDRPASTRLTNDARSCDRSLRESSVVQNHARTALFPVCDGSPLSVNEASRISHPMSSLLGRSTSGGLFSRAHGISYQSPTQGLPNYVLNPEPRTPVGKLPPKSNRTPTWLTKFAGDKSCNAKTISPASRSSNLSSASPSGVEDAAVTPRTSGSRRQVARGARRNSVGRTPKSLARKLQCETPPRVASRTPRDSQLNDQGSPASILRYFSPKGRVCKNVKQGTRDKETPGTDEDVL